MKRKTRAIPDDPFERLIDYMLALRGGNMKRVKAIEATIPAQQTIAKKAAPLKGRKKGKG